MIRQFGLVLSARLRDGDSNFRRAYVELLVDKVELSSTGVRICGTRAALEHALIKDEDTPPGAVPIVDREWCGREDSNFHGLSPTTTSTLRVYQFRHDRTCTASGGAGGWQAVAPSKAIRGVQLEHNAAYAFPVSEMRRPRRTSQANYVAEPAKLSPSCFASRGTSSWALLKSSAARGGSQRCAGVIVQP